MKTRIKTIETAYNTIAEEWATAFANEHDDKPKDIEMFKRFAHEMWGRVPVWDFGCGIGNTTRCLRDLGLDISGLDLSDKMLEQARQLYPGIHFQKGNMLKLDFETGSIAGIVAFYAIIHFTEEMVKEAFLEVYRVLEPGGLFLFTFHVGSKKMYLNKFLGKTVNIEFLFFTRSFIFNCLSEAGFESIDIVEREPYVGKEFESQRAYVFARKKAEGGEQTR